MKKQLKRIMLCLPLMLLFAAVLCTAASAAQMSDFDFARYGSDYPDILRAYGPEIYRSDLYLHYLNSGADEGRVAYSISTGEKFVLDEGEKQAYEHQKTLKTAQARMDNAVLEPDNDWPAELQAAAGNVVQNVSGSTPYEKLRSCYEWLIVNCSYAHTEQSLSGSNVSRIARYAYPIFEQNTGVCDNYAAAFTVMARMLGFDARMQNGRTHKASGGYTGHTWCVINVHGVDYVFDPQVDDNLSKNGSVSYQRFCKTYDEVSGKYIRAVDDTVRDDIMNSTSNDALPRYSFGYGGQYVIEVNAMRAEAGAVSLQWDEDLATVAYRLALGMSFDDAEKFMPSNGRSYTRKSAPYGMGIFYETATDPQLKYIGASRCGSGYGLVVQED